MTMRTIPVSEFKARCTSILRELVHDGSSIRVTSRGKVVAVVSPPAPARIEPRQWLGSLRGTVLAYEDPCGPAVDSSSWEATR